MDLHPQDMHLIDKIMDANRLADGWQALLDEFIDHFNLRHVNLYMIDSKFNVVFQEWSGAQPTIQALQDYMENIFPQDKVHQTMLASPECKWITGNFEPYQSMLNAMPGFDRWTKEHNFPYTTGCVLYRGKQGQVQVTFQRGKEHGPFSQEEEDRFTQVSRYLAKAIELRVKLADQGKNDLRFRSVLNKMKLPVSAVNEFGEIVAHNDAMMNFLQNQNTLVLNDNSQFQLPDEESQRYLTHAIAKNVANGKDLESSFDSDSNIIVVKSKGKDDSFFIGTCELNEKSDGDDQFSGAMLYVVSSDLIKPVEKNQLKSLFGLTESEAQVCQWFAQNKSLKEIAGIESKSVNTVREQLQNSYKKTKTENQLELLNLLASLPAA